MSQLKGQEGFTCEADITSGNVLHAPAAMEAKLPIVLKYDDKSLKGGPPNCTIKADRIGTSYVVTIYWPAGCQDFPDVFRCASMPIMAQKLRVAQSMVKQLGFVPQLKSRA